MTRCSWVDEADAEYVAYHDNEWGVPVHDDRLLFEMLVLESFVAGLSWQCVLHKRQAFRRAFDDFKVALVAKYDKAKVAELLANPRLIRHRGKIEAAIANAKVFLQIQSEWGSFDKYLWHWTDGTVVLSDGCEVKSALSDTIARDLKLRGMKFLGSTTIYAYLCAVGVVSGHQRGCKLKRCPNNLAIFS